MNRRRFEIDLGLDGAVGLNTARPSADASNIPDQVDFRITL
jgi:hypothetical protein